MRFNGLYTVFTSLVRDGMTSEKKNLALLSLGSRDLWKIQGLGYKVKVEKKIVKLQWIATYRKK